MAKDDDIFDEKLSDSDDFLDLDLSDLSTDDVVETPGSEDSEDIIDLTELVEKGDAGEEEGEEDLLKLLGDDEFSLEEDDLQAPKSDTMDDAAEKKLRKLAKTIPEVDFPGTDTDEDETEGITTTLTDIDLSEIVDDRELSLTADFGEDEEINENAISLEDFDKTLEDMPAPKMPPQGTQELSDDIVPEIDQIEPLDVDLITSEDEVVQEDISEEDMEKILEEESIEEIDFELDTSLESDDLGVEPLGEIEMDESVQEIDLGLESLEEFEDAPINFTETEPEDLTEDTEVESVDLGLGEEAIPLAPEVPDEEAGPEPAPELSPEPTVEAAIGVSEEKVEEIITRVVQDTVERVVKETFSEMFAQDTIEKVARDTMTEVAEKVISDAINALKQSLETDSE